TTARRPRARRGGRAEAPSRVWPIDARRCRAQLLGSAAHALDTHLAEIGGDYVSINLACLDDLYVPSLRGDTGRDDGRDVRALLPAGVEPLAIVAAAEGVGLGHEQVKQVAPLLARAALTIPAGHRLLQHADDSSAARPVSVPARDRALLDVPE